MRKNYLWIVLLCIVFSLVACSETEGEKETGREPELPSEELKEEERQEVELLSSKAIEEIVINNLDQMEASQDEYVYEEAMGIVDETIVNPENDTEEVAELVEATKEKFKNLVSEEIIDDWTRGYLSIFYWTMSRQHLNSNDINARFEVLNQSEDSFEVGFIRLADDGGYYPAGTYYLDYVKENGHWVLQEANFISAQEKPLNITLKDVEEYHAKFDRTNPEVLSLFEAVEEIEVDGESYLIFKAYNMYHARSAIDSEYNIEVSDPYNSQSN